MQSQYFTAKATSNAPTQTFAQWLATQSPSKTYTSGGNIIFAVIGSITPSEYSQLEDSHDQSKLYLSESVKYLHNKKQATALYQVWFGTSTASRYKKVKQFFDETKDGLNHPYVYNMLPDKLCGKGTLAHVDSILKGKRQHVVNVCPLFFTSSADERIVTCIHEMTHDSAATEDEKINGVVAYGDVKAKQLAATNPNSAILNAENYALFAEAVHTCKVNPLKRQGVSGSCTSTGPKKTKPWRMLMNALLKKLMQVMMVNE